MNNSKGKKGSGYLYVITHNGEQIIYTPNLKGKKGSGYLSVITNNEERIIYTPDLYRNKFPSGEFNYKLTKEDLAITNESFIYYEYHGDNAGFLFFILYLKELQFVIERGANINVVVPYWVASRNDKNDHSIFHLDILHSMVYDYKFNFITYDLHNELAISQHLRSLKNITWNCKPELQNIPTFEEAKKYFRLLIEKNNPFVVIPDKGSVTRVHNFLNSIGVHHPNIIKFDKVRDEHGNISFTGFSVDVKIKPNKNQTEYEFIIVDDICDGGGTFLKIQELLKKKFGEDIKTHLFVTHGFFTNNAKEKLIAAGIEVSCLFDWSK